MYAEWPLIRSIFGTAFQLKRRAAEVTEIIVVLLAKIQ